MAALHVWNDKAVQALTLALRALCPQAGVEVVGSIDSTNAELMRRGQGTHSTPTLLVALSQLLRVETVVDQFEFLLGSLGS